MRITTRNGEKASGRITIFSVLNVEAARSARRGNKKLAVSLVKAAGRIENGPLFARLTALLSGRTPSEVTAAMEGDVQANSAPDLHEVVRLIALETRSELAKQSALSALSDVFVGVVSSTTHGVVVVDSGASARTFVPEWLARSAHREKVGDFLAIITDKVDENQAIVKAVPAIDVDGSDAKRFTPFGRSSSVGRLTTDDARLLSREPSALKILVPVNIEQ